MEPNLPPMPPMPPQAPPPYMAPPQYAPPPPSGRSPLFWIAIAGGCIGIPILLLAALAAIVFPVFAQAREKARQSACLSNIKIMGLATMQYAQDYDEKFPTAQAWTAKLEPYTGSRSDDSGADANGSPRFKRSIWQCPAATKDSSAAAVFGYAYNSSVSGRGASSFSGREIRLTPLIYDSENLAKNASDPFQSVAYRHSHSACVGYTDGHASVQKAKTPGSE